MNFLDEMAKRMAHELMGRAHDELVEYLDKLIEQVQGDKGLSGINKMRLVQVFNKIKEADKESIEELESNEQPNEELN